MKRCLGFLILLILLMTPMSFANESEQELVVLLIIDQSGSMEDTDPNNYRLASAELLIDTLGQQDRLGILTFASSVDVLHPIEPIGEDRQEIQEVLRQLDKPYGNTDYLAAFQTAVSLLKDQPATSQKAIVFLTDGDPYPNKQVEDPEYLANYLDQLSQAVDELALANCAVYTVGFGSSSGEILEPISQKTRALSFIDSSPKDVAGHFFSIVSSLKGREIVVDEETAGVAKQYTFTVDANTKQLNSLIVGEFGKNLPVIKGGTQKIQPSVGDGYAHFVLDEEQLKAARQWTLEIPSGDYLVQVNRDTVIQLEVISPSIQSEFSEQAEIDLVVRVSNAPPDLIVESRPLLNDEPQSDWTSLVYQDELYEGVLSKRSGSGNHSVEFRVRTEDETLTTRKVPIRINLIPELHIEITSQQEALIGDTEVTLRAWLSRGGKTLRDDQVSLEMIRLVQQTPTGEISYDLYDTGEDGDLFAKDGVYSTKFLLTGTANAQGEVQAWGMYGNQNFQLSKVLEGVTIQQPGQVVIEFNHDKRRFDSVYPEPIQVPIVIENQGEYAETITAEVAQMGDIIKNPLFRVGPGETLQTVVELLLEDQTSDELLLEFIFTPTNPATQLNQQSFPLSIYRQAGTEARKESFGQLLRTFGPAVFGLLFTLLLGGVIWHFVQKSKERSAYELRGVFFYRRPGEEWQNLKLEGTHYRLGLGETFDQVDTRLPGRKLGFTLSIRRQPGSVIDKEVGYLLDCSLPGVIYYRGVEASSFIIGEGDLFVCGGYECKINRDTP